MNLNCRSPLRTVRKVRLKEDTHGVEEDLIEGQQEIERLASRSSWTANNDALALERIDNNINKVSDRSPTNVMLPRVCEYIALDLPEINTLARTLQIRKPLLCHSVRLQPLLVKPRVATRTAA